MYDYCISTVFFSLLIIFFYCLGSVIVSEKNSIPYRFICGYLFYSFIIAIGGIIIQLLNLSWYLFFGYTILTVIALLIFIVYRSKKEKIRLFPIGVKEFLKKYWFLFIISGILIVISLAYSEWIWLNNCLDDGFYLNKIATLPYIENPFTTNASTGLVEIQNGFNSYIVNTGELEMSVYVFLLQVTPTVFTRVFLSGYNYFLFACCIYAFAEKIIKSTSIKCSENTIQYIASIILLFGFSWNFMEVKEILYVQDSWQFNTAMYYASSIVRTMGILIILVHFIENNKISIRDILLVILISVVLVSKSTIALPIIFVTCVSYLVVNFLFDDKYLKKILSIIILVLIGIIGLIIGGNDYIEELVRNLFLKNMKFYLVIGCLIIIALSFTFKSKVINKVNLIMLIILFLMESPIINNLFEKLSVYDFVAARASTTYMYTFVIVTMIYVYLFINKFKYSKKIIIPIYLVATMMLSLVSLYSYNNYNGKLLTSYKIMYNNRKIIPDSTIMLGNKLSDLADDVEEEINMIMPEGVMVDGHLHFIAIIIRSFAPEIRSISAIGRFKVSEGNDFSNFTSDDQAKLDAFITNPTKENKHNLKILLEEYPINCIVLPTAEDNEYLYEIGFDSYTKFSDIEGNISYNIYYRALQ